MSASRRIAVVGGGIAGASVAWALAVDGHAVTLVEREPELGTHATGRSAATLSETSGLRPVCALARASRPFLESPPDGFVEHPLTGPRGLLWVGRLDDEVDDRQLLDDLAAVAASGVAPNARRLTPGEVAELLPALRPGAAGAGGVWEPDARSVDVAALLAAYARGARAAGARIETAVEIGAITRTDGAWQLTATRRGEPLALDPFDIVVNAAGAWGDELAVLAGVAPVGLRPLRRTACLVPAPDVMAAEVTGWPLVMDVAGRYYFEPESGGLLLSPADEHPSAPTDARAEMEDVAWALEMLAEATVLDVRHVRREWAGLRTFAPDRIPVIGWDDAADGFVWAVGQGGAGIKTAPMIAEIVAGLVSSRPWPAALADLDVHAADFAPHRLRG